MCTRHTVDAYTGKFYGHHQSKTENARRFDYINDDQDPVDDTLGFCTHKDAFPSNKYEILGYVVLFSIVFMLFYANYVNEGYLVMSLFLFYQFTAVQTVGYINVINICVFASFFISEANTKRLFKDLLAVDYVLITVLIPFQIIGRLLGAVINHKISYLTNLSAIAFVMIFLIWKMSKRCAEMSEEEKEVILRRNTGTFVSMNILREGSYVPPRNDNSKNSHSNSSFSVGSDKGPATPFEIEEEGSLASSSPKAGFKLDDSGMNYNFSYNSRKRNRLENMNSHSSSLSNLEKSKRDRFVSLLNSEQTHYYPWNLILLILPI